MQSVSAELHGSVYNVAAPSFLKFDTEPDEMEFDGAEAEFDSDDVFSDNEIRDPDLDILLVEDGEDDVELDMVMSEPEDEEAEEDDEIAFNLDQFSDDDIEEPGEAPLNMGLPDELSDISDLEPPVLEEFAEEPKLTLGDDDLDLDLDFDLDLDEPEQVPSKVAETKSDLDELSLADLELDDEPEVVVAKKKPASDKIDLDDDLNFDLDLGDLKLDDD
jgi:hypothetical protein